MYKTTDMCKCLFNIYNGENTNRDYIDGIAKKEMIYDLSNYKS